MNWITRVAIFAQQFFFCEMSCAAAGSALVLLLLVVERFKWCKYSRLQMIWVKLTIITSLLPVMACISFFRRTEIREEGSIQSFSWWHSSTDSMRCVYSVLFAVWIIGMAVGVVWRIYQYYQLRKVLQGNIDVEEEYQSIITYYRDKYPVKNLRFYQNDLLNSPIVTGIFRPKIILPVKTYSEKELHMILQHEIAHIQRHDLLWKQFGLAASFFHWWNPLFYVLLKKLVLWEEIACDAKTCDNNSHFTKKEYGYYLSGMEDNDQDMLYASAWSDSRKEVFWRIEVLVRGTKYSKKIAVISCMALALLSAIPSFAASEGIMMANEVWTRATEVGTREELIDYGALEYHMYASEEPDVIEVEAEEEISAHSTIVVLDRTINVNTRMLCKEQEMQQGDKVFVVTSCSDSSITYRIGLKDGDGKMTYVEGK